MQHLSKIGVLAVVILLSAITPFASAQVLTEAEVSWLQYMREEEKLARDVYLHFSELFPNAKILANIAISEQAHMDAIKSLLVRYNVEDPAQTTGVGEFNIPEIDSLYKTLIAAESLVDALKAGVSIEETDIVDLEAAMAATTRLDIDRVYNNLLSGSFNHLEAFELNLLNLNGTGQKSRMGK
jgi:hypothetical protein